MENIQINDDGRSKHIAVNSCTGNVNKWKLLPGGFKIPRKKMLVNAHLFSSFFLSLSVEFCDGLDEACVIMVKYSKILSWFSDFLNTQVNTQRRVYSHVNAYSQIHTCVRRCVYVCMCVCVDSISKYIGLS